MAKEARLYNGERTACSISGAGKLDSHMEKNEMRTLSNTIQHLTQNEIKLESKT